MRFLNFSWLILFSLLSFIFYIDHTLVYGQCIDDQKFLLLQLKQNLSLSSLASSTSKLTSWNKSTDCCSWGGIECDEVGHVISLDLNSESILGGVDNSSSLFKLGYLKSLNLSLNNFSSTSIPSGLERLVNLTHLNLSNSGFGGQIPIEISRMKRLVSLDLSTLFAGLNPLKLENPDLRTLVKDLFELRELYLDGVNVSMHGREWCRALSSALHNLQVLSLSRCDLSGPFDSSLLKLQSLTALRLNENNISSQVPDFFGNFSSLTSLHLISCGLYGKFPEKIFQLPLLQSLDISGNLHLQGSLPEFPQNGSLEIIVLFNTNFSGQLPDSIGNLKFLSKLDLTYCGFSGSIPSSMSNLTRLEYLDLSSNNFSGQVPFFGLSENITYINLAHNLLTGSISSFQWDQHLKLVNLNLRNNSLNGTIPSILFTLPLLQKLNLCQNRFTGKLGEFSNRSSSSLDTLDFSSNMLEGPIPLSIFRFSNLIIFTLSSNNFSGTLKLVLFQNLRNLSSLDLSNNNLLIDASGTNSALFPQVGTLKLGSCNLRTFPEFLSNQSKMSYLDLSNNQIRGKIPNWIWKIGNGSLGHLNLSFNFLENSEQPLPGSRFRSLAVVDLHSNLLQGQIPILPPSASVLDYSINNFTSMISIENGSYLSVAIFFSLSHNFLSGEIPSSICEASYLQVLDLSSNNLGGPIPRCLGGISMLRVLNLRNNSLNDTIPDTFLGQCSLRTLDLNMNRLEGGVSKTLANCAMLEVLDLGNNQINGPFPCWLGTMPHLRVLVLRSNKFHGSIPYPKSNTTFQMLQIIDLSSNNFTGKLPSNRFLTWNAMMIDEGEAQSNYKHQILRFGFLELSQLYYQDAVTVTSKGQQMELVKILTVFTSIDLSNNRFEGEIPEAIGNLTSLYVLNLSRNSLTGSIPSSLGKLKQLESLDLSANKLTGRIPMQLADLSFLSVLNLSFNQLDGTIPPGRQFQTFNGNVFEGNSGLCGPPLSKKCSTVRLAPPSSTYPEKSSIDFDWQFIATGLGFGGGVGLVISPLWFWTKGRKWYDEQIERIVLIMFPSLLYNVCDDGRVDAVTEEEFTDEELTENTEDYGDEDMEWKNHGRYCVFCSKLDIRRKRVIHNLKCKCHETPQNSSFL